MINSLHKYFWLTPNQHRDLMLSDLMRVSTLTRLECIVMLRNEALEEEKARRLDSAFVICPRCKGSHYNKINKDNLCDKCEQTVNTIKWDKQYDNK